VSLSGRLPSCLANPEGSLVAGMSAEPRDLPPGDDDYYL